MSGNLIITVWDRDPDYLGIDIRATNERYSGTARLYAGINAMSELADVITGFPTTPHDEREYVFGTQKPGFAGGFCSLQFRCTDGVGHAHVEIMMQDDATYHEPANASFGFPVTAAGIDLFVPKLRQIDQNLLNEAELS
ncbi:MAG TPA: hypothetical protein VFX97_00400 [Pyrinomonadaceae bacterium]|nr:hypothetical protein [Pyrinomonadaceae bacterium]